MAFEVQPHKFHRDFCLPVRLLNLARKRYAIWGALAGMMVLARVALLPLLPIPSPHVHDEFSYLLAADTYAHGRLKNPPLPTPDSFLSPHILVSPFYASKYPPGQGAVLALGQKFFGHPYWGVVLSTALMVFLFGWAADAWLPPQWALIATGMTAIFFFVRHYWFTSYWGGSLTACGGALVVGGLGYALRDRWSSAQWSVAAGAAILAFTRPYEGGVLVLATACVLLINWKTELWRRVLLPNAAILLLVVLPAFLWVNAAQTGDPLNFPYKIHLEKYESAPLFWMQGPWNLVTAPNSNTTAYGEWMHDSHVKRLQLPVLWALGFQMFMLAISGVWVPFLTFGLLLLAVPWVRMRGRKKWLVLLLGSGAIAILAELSITPHYEAPFTIVQVILITAAMRAVWYRMSTLPARGPIFFGLLVLLLAPMTVDYATQLQVKTDPRSELFKRLEADGGDHIVFVDYEKGWNFLDEWVYNGADLASQRVIFAHLLSEDRNQGVIRDFPGRTIWRLKLGPSETDVQLARVNDPAASIAER